MRGSARRAVRLAALTALIATACAAARAQNAGTDKPDFSGSDEIALEAALGWEPLPTPTPAVRAVKAVPTNAELRQRAARLGVELPPTYLETVRNEARDHMLACLRGADEQAGN